jgi:hypothetical protein
MRFSTGRGAKQNRPALAEPNRQPLPQQARNDVGQSVRGKADDDADRTSRMGLRTCAMPHCRKHRGADGAMKLHVTNRVPHFFRVSTSFAFAVEEPIPVANKNLPCASDNNKVLSTTHVVLRLDTATKCARLRARGRRAHASLSQLSHLPHQMIDLSFR